MPSFNEELIEKGDLPEDSIARRAAERKASRSDRSATVPGRMGDQQHMRRLEDQINQLTVELEDAKKQGVQAEVILEELHEVPGRRRKLTAAEYAELVANLEHNPLVTPITVRKREDGKFEIISGHNRAAAFRDLKRETIPAVIADTDQAQADINAFYANLLQTDLSDYEKYLGFRMLQERFPDLKQADIARQSGKSETTISQLMSFQDLPEKVLEMLDENPAILGSHAAADFALLTKKGKTEQVIDAMTKIASGELDQGKAVKLASTSPAADKISAKAEEKIFKVGKTKYCTMRRANKVLRLEFKTDEEAAEVMQALDEFIAKRAESMK